MSTKMLRYHIIESIKLLASDGKVQLAYFPDFVCKGDEIANSLGDWLLMYRAQRTIDDKYAFHPDELTEIVNLDKEVSMLSFDDFSDSSILNSYKWENIRDKAKKVLFLLNEEYSLPDKNSV